MVICWNLQFFICSGVSIGSWKNSKLVIDNRFFFVMLFATRITRSLPYTKINLSLSVLSQAIHEIISKIAIKTRGVGGSTHQVPVERRSTQ